MQQRSAESEDGNSGSMPAVGNSSGSAKKKSSAKKSSSKISTSRSAKILENSLDGSKNNTEQSNKQRLMFLSEALHASLSVQSAKCSALKIQGTYTQPLSNPYASFDLDTSSWNKCQESFHWMKEELLENTSGDWSRSGMISSGTAYLLPPLVRVMRGIDSGLLPTPQAMDLKGYVPQSAIKFLRGITKRASGADISKDLKHSPLFYLAYVQAGSRKFNPCFFESLMGYPIGHTELKPVATESSAESHS